MDITELLSDEAVLQELGRRIQRQRLALDLTQRKLATEAGLSIPTVQRLEAGSSVQLQSLIRILRALQLLSRLEALVPSSQVRPMELLERGKPKQRASGTSRAEPPWKWED